MGKDLHISTLVKRSFILTLLLMVSTLLAFGQLEVSVGEHVQCENSNVLLPVDVSEFNDVAAFTFHISIDTLEVVFVGVENPHDQLSGGGIVSNFMASSSRIIITWQSLMVANLVSGKLFDLKLTYFEDSAALDFENDCEVVLSDFTIVENAVYVDGLLLPAIQFATQPQPQTVTEGEQAMFSLSLQNNGGQLFQWQQNDGSGWNDIEDLVPFSGVNTPDLMIDDVPVAFNGNTYRCRIEFDVCMELSDSALLTVNPLTVLEKNSVSTSKLKVFPNPCSASFHYEMDVALKNCRLRMINQQGKVVYKALAESPGTTVALGHISQGTYLLQMLDKAGMVIETVSVVVH